MTGFNGDALPPNRVGASRALTRKGRKGVQGAARLPSGDFAVTSLNLVKLSVGSKSVESLAAWQASPAAQAEDGLPRHITRMWPRRAQELLAGGSIYWVIEGAIRCRQPIVRLDAVMGADGIRRCALVMAPGLLRTDVVMRRPFQGWRYLKPQDSPADLPSRTAAEPPLPEEMAVALAAMGLRRA